MTIRLEAFAGELPRLHPRQLPVTHAQRVVNSKMENGALTPFRQPKLKHTLPANAQTIYKDGTGWLAWNALVNVVPGPVATERLYITGDGAPKLLVGGVGGNTFPLALPAPTAKPTVERRVNNEWFTFGSEEFLLRDGIRRTTDFGWEINVSVRGGTATITCTHETGFTTTQMANMVNAVRYRNAAVSASTLVPSLKIIRITEIRDSGGQDNDDLGNPVGGDTSPIYEVGATVRVNGTTLSHTFGTPAALSSTDIADQNDPPIITTTGLNPTYSVGAGQIALFSGTVVNTVEAGQTIIGITFTVEGLANGVLAPTDPTRTDFLYTYTWVTDLGEESQPAPVSAIIGWINGVSVRVSGFGTPPAGRNVTKMRLYRSETAASGRTDLYLIAERDAATGPWDDAVELLPIMEPIPSVDFDPPPANLSGIVAMPNGMMAAFAGRDLYFSEPWQPHAWPRKYSQRTDWPIVGLAAFGTSLAVLTTGQPYIADGLHPEQVRMEKLDVSYPCVAARSIVDMGEFVAYATREGLVVIDSAGARLVTREMVTREDWNGLTPSSFVCGRHQGRYIIGHDDRLSPNLRRCVIIDLTGDKPFLTQSNVRPRAMHFDMQTGTLHFIQGDFREIYEFDPITGPFATQIWRSKEFILNQAISYSCILVDADLAAFRGSLLVKVIADGKHVGSITRPNRVERIRGGRLARKWELEVHASMQVTAITMAGSPDDIVAAASVT